MEEILEKLFLSLKETFENKLNSKEQKTSSVGEIDVFKTYLSLSKSQKDFRILIESSAINKEVLEYEFSKEIIDNAARQSLIRYGSTLNDNKLFIASNGLYQYYINKGFDLNQVFITFDDNKFNQEKLKLKLQEKIWCIFLILFGADNKDTLLDTSKLDSKTLESYFLFFQLIESELEKKGLILGKKIGWGTGKDVNFRKFITNNVDLPNTGIYNDRPTSMYWLDFGKKKNVSFLLDLFFDAYNNEERLVANVLFLEALRQMSNKMLTELGEIPSDLNTLLVMELSN
jgi:hypothetical protein